MVKRADGRVTNIGHLVSRRQEFPLDRNATTFYGVNRRWQIVPWREGGDSTFRHTTFYQRVAPCKDVTQTPIIWHSAEVYYWDASLDEIFNQSNRSIQQCDPPALHLPQARTACLIVHMHSCSYTHPHHRHTDCSLRYNPTPKTFWMFGECLK